MKKQGKRLLLCFLAVLVSSTHSDAASWLFPGQSGHLTSRQLCTVSLQWLDAGRGASNDQLAQLQHDGHLVVLAPGTKIVDHGSMVWPPHAAVTQVIVRSGPYHGAKCWISGPAPKVR